VVYYGGYTPYINLRVFLTAYRLLTSVIINKQGTFRPFATPLYVYPPPFLAIHHCSYPVITSLCAPCRQMSCRVPSTDVVFRSSQRRHMPHCHSVELRFINRSSITCIENFFSLSLIHAFTEVLSVSTLVSNSTPSAIPLSSARRLFCRLSIAGGVKWTSSLSRIPSKIYM